MLILDYFICNLMVSYVSKLKQGRLKLLLIEVADFIPLQ